MGLNTKNLPKGGNTERVEQENLKAGTYPARVVQIIDLGLQPQRPYKGQDKPPAHEISMTYELTDEFMKDKDGNELEDKPRWISESFAIKHLDADLATSTKRYKAIDPDEKYEGDFAKLIEEPCMVTIVNNESKGKIYDNVAAITGMRPRDAAKCPPLVNKPKVFDLTDPDMEVFNALPKWLQEKIQSNLNFNGSLLQERLQGAPKKEKKEAPKEEAPVDDSTEDNLPF